ncbi:MAG: hypothetical protein H0W28_04830 [Pyrinomonadaceae bacterium]|nr:hypothetical protein [Pyrinomonadaceae bacterium]
MITRLANVRQIRLRQTSAILRYENQNVDAQEAGRALSSDYVVMGTVQKVEERLRVSVQLLRASDGALIWGKPYDEPRASLLDLQDSIAERKPRSRCTLSSQGVTWIIMQLTVWARLTRNSVSAVRHCCGYVRPQIQAFHVIPGMRVIRSCSR